MVLLQCLVPQRDFVKTLYATLDTPDSFSSFSPGAYATVTECWHKPAADQLGVRQPKATGDRELGRRRLLSREA